MGSKRRTGQVAATTPAGGGQQAPAAAGSGSGGIEPRPGEVWVTDHGVRMSIPKKGASFTYIRLHYYLAGKRCQRTVGRDWRAAWLEANRVDALLAAERGDTDGLTVKALSEAWVKACAADWSPRYASDVQDALDKRVLPAMGSVKLGDLTRAHSRATIEAQASASGRKRVRALLSSMFHWGLDEQWLRVEVRTILPPAGRDQDGSRLRYLPRDSAPATDDVLALASALVGPRTYESKHARKAFTQPDEWSLMVLVAGFCGLRLGEVFALTGDAVDGQVLRVSQQAQWIDNEPKLLATKNSARRKRPPREVFIPEKVGDFQLRALLAQRAREVGDGLMFPAPRGGVWRKQNFYRSVMNPARSVAWPGREWTFHDLRHHFCRWHLDAGVAIADVSRMAGHENVFITMTLYITQIEGVTDRVAAKHRS